MLFDEMRGKIFNQLFKCVYLVKTRIFFKDKKANQILSTFQTL